MDGFRTKMTYNDCTIVLLNEAVKHATGNTLEFLLQERVCKPLRLTRTTLGPHSTENHATSYITLSDGTPHAVPPPAFEDGQIRIPVASGKSSINDLIVFMRAILRVHENETARPPRYDTSVPHLGQYDAMWMSLIDINTETGYGLGWIVADLPCKGGILGSNANNPNGQPIIARGTR